MDTADYIALDQYLRRITGKEKASRSPILLINEVPMNPGWSTVLVAYESTPLNADGTYDRSVEEQASVALLGYCPNKEWSYTSKGRTNPGGWAPNFTNDPDPDVTVYYGEGAYVAAQVDFTNRFLQGSLETEADNQGMTLKYTDASLVEHDREDVRVRCPMPRKEVVPGDTGEEVVPA